MLRWPRRRGDGRLVLLREMVVSRVRSGCECVAGSGIDGWIPINGLSKETERSGVSKKRGWPATVAARGCNSRARRKKRESGWTKVARGEGGEGGEGDPTGQELEQRWAAVTLSLPSPFRAARGRFSGFAARKTWRGLGKPLENRGDHPDPQLINRQFFKGEEFGRQSLHLAPWRKNLPPSVPPDMSCLGREIIVQQTPHRSWSCPKPRASDCRALRLQQARLFLLPLRSADIHLLFHFHFCLGPRPKRSSTSVQDKRDLWFPCRHETVLLPWKEWQENSGLVGKTLRERCSVGFRHDRAKFGGWAPIG